MKVAELIEKLSEYDADSEVAVRMSIGVGMEEDVYTDTDVKVTGTRRGLVLVESR